MSPDKRVETIIKLREANIILTRLLAFQLTMATWAVLFCLGAPSNILAANCIMEFFLLCMVVNCERAGSVDIAVVWLMCTCVGIIAALTAAPLALLWFGLLGVSTSKYLTMIEDRQTALDEIKLELF